MWEWGEEQDAAFNKIKLMVTTAPLLKYYEPNKKLTIQCDASSTGLGATLLQDDQPLAYASRALTEQRYAQIEKECLAIVFATERFHQYTFGRKTIVTSDHKPLESIFVKPLCKAPKRIQAMLLKLLQYDLQVVYKRGAELYIADMLSRAHPELKPNQKDPFSNINAVSHLRVSTKTAKALKDATAVDETMRDLKDVIFRGWPEHKEDVSVQVAPYFSFRDELTFHDGLIMKGERIVIPKAERNQVKSYIHASHLGQGSALRRARDCVYWPGMTDEIKQMIETFEACNTYQASQQKETLQPTLPETEFPWQKVGVDLFSVKNKDYMVTVCYQSGYWEVDRLCDTSARAVINKLKCHFARFGIPNHVVSDNGPQFSSHEFAEFAEKWDFEHFTSSPGHANANGKAEAAVKQAKLMIMKCNKSGCDPMIALLEIRNTPQQDSGTSLAQRLLNRRTRTLLPVTTNLLRPRGEELRKRDMEVISKSVKKRVDQYNRSAKDMKPLYEGDTVRIKPFQLGDKQWAKGTIVKRLDDRSYEVESNGYQGTIRRNRVHLRKSKELSDTQADNKPVPAVQKTMGNRNISVPKESPPSESTGTPPISAPASTPTKVKSNNVNAEQSQTLPTRRSTRNYVTK